MPDAEGALTPRESAYVATNAYFTLEGWIDGAPRAGLEERSKIRNRVIGPGDVGTQKDSTVNPSLRGTGLEGSKLESVHKAQTGFGTTSGFGYTLAFEGRGGERHVVIATRGTRPEMPGMPDLVTDLRAAMTPFGSFGLVHKGFKKTFDSILPSLDRDRLLIRNAHVIHCVGHSLGGAVATLVAGHLAGAGRAVKLYTYGSPRVGVLDTYRAFQKAIGPQNIYRVAHDLDPITLIGPYPYIHVQPAPGDPHNLTLLSPTSRLLSTANHDMAEYIQSVQTLEWKGVRRRANAVDHDDALVTRWLLHRENDTSWIRYGSAKTLALLFKLFSSLLKTISTSLILGLTALDLLAEILYHHLHRMATLGKRVLQLLEYAAQWAGLAVQGAADFTAAIIRAILGKMLASLRELAHKALSSPTSLLSPMTIDLGSLVLAHASML